MKAEELTQIASDVADYKKHSGNVGRLGVYLPPDSWDELLAEARLAAQLRKFVEEHGDELLCVLRADAMVPDSPKQAEPAVRLLDTFRELLAAARGEKA